MTQTTDRPTEAARSISYGSREDLLAGRTLRHKDVHVAALEKTFRVRELRQNEAEEVHNAIVHQEPDEKGKVIAITDMRGYKARILAYALILPDPGMTQMFANPATDWTQINAQTQDVVDILFSAAEELSPLSKKSRDAVGKDSAKATS